MSSLITSALLGVQTGCIITLAYRLHQANRREQERLMGAHDTVEQRKRQLATDVAQVYGVTELQAQVALDACWAAGDHAFYSRINEMKEMKK